jgi:hypothetical protein
MRAVLALGGNIQIKGWRLGGAKALRIKALMCVIENGPASNVNVLSRFPKGWS